MPRSFVLLVLLFVLGSGCSSGMRPPGGIAGAPAAQAAIERFLQYAAVKDYAGMGWVFGTSSGPVVERDPLGEVEQRMYALANLLEHDSFIIAGGSPVPGRTGGAMSFQVTIMRGGRTFEVPFTAVRGPQERWYVEQLTVEALTAG
jgi:hypothetical protein